MMVTAETTLDELSALLSQAVVDHRFDISDKIYVTGLAFPFWLEIDRRQPFLVLSTHLQLHPDAGIPECLGAANTLNLGTMMLQFSFDEDLSRLNAHFALPLQDPLGRNIVIRTARLFADIFSAATRVDDIAKLAEIWPVGEDAPDAATSGNRRMH